VCEGGFRFSNEIGGILCSVCAKRYDEEIIPSAIVAWNYICDCPVEKLFSFSADEKCIENLGKISESYFLHHTDITLKSLEYYKTIK